MTDDAQEEIDLHGHSLILWCYGCARKFWSDDVKELVREGWYDLYLEHVSCPACGPHLVNAVLGDIVDEEALGETIDERVRGSQRWLRALRR